MILAAGVGRLRACARHLGTRRADVRIRLLRASGLRKTRERTILRREVLELVLLDGRNTSRIADLVRVLTHERPPPWFIPAPADGREATHPTDSMHSFIVGE
jgi:hypothetical protein